MKQELSVTITVPDEYILIKKIEWEEMIENQLSGRQWEMKDLVERIGRNLQWFKDNILYAYKNELSTARGGFVKYPESKGMPWKFGAAKMGYVCGLIQRHMNLVMKIN